MKKSLRLLRSILIIELLWLSCALTARAVIFTSDTLIDFGDSTYDGADVVVTNCTVTINGAHSFASLQVLNAGKLTHEGSSSGLLYHEFPTNEQLVLTGTTPVALNCTNVLTFTTVVTDPSGSVVYGSGVDYLLVLDGQGITTIQRTDTSSIPDGGTVRVTYDALSLLGPTGLNLTIIGDLLVEQGGAINVKGLGYNDGFGPGRGAVAGSPTTGGGGGYGGFGGLSSSNAAGGTTYGQVLQPVDKGSEGGRGTSGPGASGGGAIKLAVGGLLRVSGSLYANGANASVERAGGGAGGSIWLTAQTLAGPGYIFADGGDGEPAQGGGGGGGRIAIYCQTNNFLGILSARGGRGAVSGGAGTIYTRVGQGIGNLLVDNGGRSGAKTALSAPEPFDMTVKRGGTVSITASQTIGNLLLTSNGWVSMSGPILTVRGNATIQSGSGINADGLGYAAMYGPGAGKTSSYSGYTVGSGAGYGGAGASVGVYPGGALGGGTYGSATQPVETGSGGGNGTGSYPYSWGGAGGGAIRLTVTGTLTLDGKISANGNPGVGEASGGGSGGSIQLNVGTLSGSGVISANGGMGNDIGGGGGGGRIAAYYQASSFAGSMRACGGGSSGNFGGAGTIYTKVTGQAGQLMADNGGQSTVAVTGVSATELLGLIVQGGAVVSPTSPQTIGSLFIASNSWLRLTNFSLNIMSDATVQAGGGIIADGTGFPAGQGPGAGRSVSYYPPGGPSYMTGGGGGHGGGGATSMVGAGGGYTYDSAVSPTQFGSGGGNGTMTERTNSAGAGGGVIRLSVSGKLTIDGRLSADGTAGTSQNSGGGSGGSIYLSVGTLSGSGLISANGGFGNGMGGGGGGGRIAITYNANSFSGPTRAWGAGGGGTNFGGAGTIYLKPYNLSAQLIVDNGGPLGAISDVGPQSSYWDVIIKGGGVTSLSSQGLNNLLIGSNSWLLLSNQTLTITGNATIQNGGGIRADAGGSPAGAGQGAGRTYVYGNTNVGSGGGYGGCGGAGGIANAAGGVGFGYVAASTPLMGSGGGNGTGSPYSNGGAGGGFVVLQVTGSLVVDGRVSANGGDGVGLHSGGGSGGGISLSAAALFGSGTISANGGWGNGLGGGGGGGRIVLQPTANFFAGTTSAFGGGGANRGGAGTVFTQLAGQNVGQVLVDNGGWLGTNTYLPDSGTFDVSIRGGGIAYLPSSGFAFRDLFIAANGWLSAWGPMLSVNGNATIQAGGGITADGTGFRGGQGPGAGYSATVGIRGGASYGGYGGGNPSADPYTYGYGKPYGSLQAPSDPGSGGGNGGGYSYPPYGGAGGGPLRLNVTGTLALNGRISADGLPGDLNSGGGSGGSVWITAGTLLGSGTISANGGAGNGMAGGGGGGRIALTYGSSLFSGAINAFGGGGYAWGGAGTIYTKANNQSFGQVIVDNGGRSGTNTSLGSYSSSTFDLTVKSGAGVVLNPGPSIRNLLLFSNAWMIPGTQGPMNITGDAIIQAGGLITADGAGSAGGQGSGAGRTLTTPYGTAGSGAGYGGFGASGGTGAAGGNTYGSITSPTGPGSGGGTGAGNIRGGAGGGVVFFNVTGTLQVDGKISAGGARGMGPGAGGGSGGGVFLTVGKLSGSGMISANGGAGEGLGGGGGGGRIAVIYRTNVFAGLLTAFGGGGAGWGGAGTVFTRPLTSSGGSLLVDNGGNSGTNTPLTTTGYLDLTVQNGAAVYPSSSYSAWSNLTVNAGGTVTCLNGLSSMSLVVLGNSRIEAGGTITVDGKGFAQGLGPGAGRSFNGIGSGAGYGGNGGASSVSTGGVTYGSAQQPVDRGSGGGLGWGQASGGGEGGGSLRLDVAGTLTVNGRLSANGNAALQDDGGGGSGGSLYVTAGTLTGSGLFSADGGPGEFYEGGGGGGGRIAVYARNNTFAGQFSAAGAEGYFWGEDGSVYLSSDPGRLAVISQTPAGMVSNGVSTVELLFNTAVDPNSVSSTAVALTTPRGPQTVSVSALDAARLRVSFPMQTSVGDYSLQVGQLKDLAGQAMSEVYTGAFSVLLPVISGTIVDTNGQPVAGVQLWPNDGSSPVTTDANGNYTMGVLGGDVTITPVLNDLVFVPGSRAYAGITTSLSGQDYLTVSSIVPVVGTQFTATSITMNWYGISGVSYQAVCSTNLVDWVPYGDVVMGANGPLQVQLPIGPESKKFFRLGASN